MNENNQENTETQLILDSQQDDSEFDIQLRKDIEELNRIMFTNSASDPQGLLSFDYVAEIGDSVTELSALNSIKIWLGRIYNLELLLVTFILCKYLFDKTCGIFERIWRAY